MHRAPELDVRLSGADLLKVERPDSVVAFLADRELSGVVVCDDGGLAIAGQGFGMKIALTRIEASRLAKVLRHRSSQKNGVRHAR